MWVKARSRSDSIWECHSQSHLLGSYVLLTRGQRKLGMIFFLDGVLDATNYGPACILPVDEIYPKTFWSTWMWNPPGNRSEDCLQLNVFVPEGAKNASVLVWIFGGGFYSGSAVLTFYDGSVLAVSQQVVVVTMNYRVGMLGFLSTGDGRIRGNFGLKDQLLALQWVRDNIADLGGNPDSVTLFGESAGGASVGFHMMSPLSQGLFQRGVIHSASPGARWAYMTPSQAMKRSDAMFQKFNCNQPDTEKLLECLRALKAEDIGNDWNDYIVTNILMFAWVPTIDGEFIPDDPFEMTRKGFPSDAELMIGFNKDEGTFWNLYAYPQLTKDKAYCPLSAEEFDRAARSALSTFPRDVQDDVVRMYSKDITDGNSRTVALDRITGEFLSFSCPTALFANAFSDGGTAKKVYMYKLDYRASNEMWPEWMGVIHGADIQWFFGTPLNQDYIDLHKSQHNVSDYTAAEKTLARKITTFLGSFAKTGTPSSQGDPAWPKYDTTSYQGLRITPTGTLETMTVNEGTRCSTLWQYQKTDDCCDLNTGHRYSTFGGSLTVSDEGFPWKDTLLDTNSPYYDAYSRIIKQELKTTLSAYKDPGIQTASIKVLGFGAGSVTAYFDLTTKHYLKGTDAEVAKALASYIAGYWTGGMKIDKKTISVSPKTVCSTSSECEGKPCVNSRNGCVKGKVRSLDVGKGEVKVNQFFNIPFAQPPVGKLRFADPLPAKSWVGVHDGTAYGPSCMLSKDTTFPGFWPAEMWNPPGKMSEDCLQLNIFTPHGVKNAPVLVWIYGGGYYSGTSTLELYDGSVLAASQKAVVVTINYRVGILGFLSTGDGRIKGNYGIKDQRLALQWIQNNIARFGGNPRSVTLFGESAGAASIGLHILSDTTKNLFQRAVMESASPNARWAFMSVTQAKRRGARMLEILKCQQSDADAVLACLRAKSAESLAFNSADWIVKNAMIFPWAPTPDGEFLKGNPFEMTEAADFNRDVDIMIGFNKNEGTYWNLYLFSNLYSKDKQQCPITVDQFNTAADGVLMNFTAPARKDIKQIYSSGVTDGNALTVALDRVVGEFLSFSCPVIEFTNKYSAGARKAYMYKLDHRASNEQWPAWMGVIHGADIQWFFGIPLDTIYNEKHIQNDKIPLYTEAEKEFAKKIMDYLGTFARNGSPGKAGIPKWPAYTKDNFKALHFTETMNIEEVILVEGTRCAPYARLSREETCCVLT
ncbi:uncharacterized protein LOC135487621 isoform X2 [Lineus longissimus]|uniref:uncharacterized protein LOC135487621 isoform X2 n=1 Tax=Lineus longissimus TaxID=88925 RepID=UPI00315DBED7